MEATKNMTDFEKAMRDSIGKGVTFSSVCREIVADCKKLELSEVDRAIADAHKVHNDDVTGLAPEGEKS